MTIWYVRPDATHGGANNGASFDNAWQGWAAIVWGGAGIIGGDTLYLCGVHAASAAVIVGAHGATSDANRVVIRGDYAPLPGSFAFTGSGYLSATRDYTSFVGFTLTSATGNSIYVSAAAGTVIDSCEFIGGSSGVALSSSTVFTDARITNNICHGQTIAGITHAVSTAAIAPANITVSKNEVYDSALYGIYFTMTSAAWTSSTFNNFQITDNIVHDCAGSSIYARACHNDFVTLPTVYSPGLLVANNTIDRCGTTAGANGNHGGISVHGFNFPLIANNTVRNCFVTGAGIQTDKNKNPRIFNNRISGIRSGTPTAAYQNGFPIDGNGIFFDVLTIGGIASGNHISDLVSTGNSNSGTGLAFWNCDGASFVGNVVENCYRGANYGDDGEQDNHINHNTFINCDVGIDKVGTLALAGSITVKNNIFVNCATGFNIGANPSITADYNCIHGATTAYVGISAGANDIDVNPLLDALYRPAAATVKRAGTYLGGKDFNGKQFYDPPNIGAVDDLSTTPRYLLTNP